MSLRFANHVVASGPRKGRWIRLLLAMCVLFVLAPTSAYAGGGHKKRGGHHGGHGKRHGGGTATTPAPADDGGGDTADTGSEDTAPDAGPADTGGGGGPIDAKETGGKNGKPKVFDFTGLDINGRLRTPQLLYFLERANEELERASLEKRSFIPEMVRTLDEERL